MCKIYSQRICRNQFYFIIFPEYERQSTKIAKTVAKTKIVSYPPHTTSQISPETLDNTMPNINKHKVATKIIMIEIP